MESRLEAYRAKKREALEEDQKRAKYWDLITLAPIRRRIFGEDTTKLTREIDICYASVCIGVF